MHGEKSNNTNKEYIESAIMTNSDDRVNLEYYPFGHFVYWNVIKNQL